MKNRKLNQLLVAGMISAAMMTSGISVQAADFSDDTSTVEEQSVGSAEEEAPEVEDGSEFQSDAAEASSAVAVSSANFPDAKFRQYVLDNIDTDKDKKLSAAEIKAAKTIDVSGLGISNLKGIERFTYATDLFAANNKLTSVNITKNTKVAYLNLLLQGLQGSISKPFIPHSNLTYPCDVIVLHNIFHHICSGISDHNSLSHYRLCRITQFRIYNISLISYICPYSVIISLS